MNPPGHTTVLNPMGSDFDQFLYAPVGDDRQGGVLSVISALARVGVDPWDQAMQLARMPADAAAALLAALLAKLPQESGKPADPVPLATRLIALLPRGPRQRGPATKAVAQEASQVEPNYLLLALLYVLGLLLMLGARQLVQLRPAAEAPPAVVPAAQHPAAVPSAPGRIAQ